MYDPTVGRWLTQDPLGVDAGDVNLYRYVKNCPTNATDPSGLQAYAINGRARDYILTTLSDNGIPAYAVQVGNFRQEDIGRGELWLILPDVGKGKKARAPRALPDGLLEAIGDKPTEPNKVFYYGGDYPDLLWGKELDAEALTPAQRLTVFKANFARYGADAKDSIGYAEFKALGAKAAGWGAVFGQVRLEYGKEGADLLQFAKDKKVRIEWDNDAYWFTEKDYANGTVTIAENKRAGVKYATTVEQAAKYLYLTLRDNKENIQEWSSQNYNDPSSIAQINDREFRLYNFGGELARGFDDLKTQAAGEVRGLMWQYATLGLNVRLSAAARAATTEREVQILSSRARGLADKAEMASEGGKQLPRGDLRATKGDLQFAATEGINVRHSSIPWSDVNRALSAKKANALSREIGEVLARKDVRRIELLEEVVHDAQKKFLRERGVDWRQHVTQYKAKLEVEAHDAMLQYAERLQFTPAEVNALKVRRKDWIERMSQTDPGSWVDYMRNGEKFSN